MATGQKLKIDNEALAEEFFEDSTLLGIVAPIKDYQFSWQLNQFLGFNFRVNNDIEIQLTKKKRSYFFSIYEYAIPSISLWHYLYNNQYDGEYLLPEFKHLDFLWLMKGDEVCDEAMQETIRTIRGIQNVQLVTELAVEKITNKENLVF